MQVWLSGHSLPHTQFRDSSQTGHGTPGAAAGKKLRVKEHGGISRDIKPL